MKPRNVMLCTLTFTLCDLTISTVLYTYSCKKASIFEDVMHFNIFHSMLDVWGTTLLRTCICVGAVIGVAWNRANGPQRLQASITPMTLLCYLIASYAMIKLLLFSEEEKPVQDAWFWSLLSWTWLSSAMTLFAWKQMGEFTPCIQETTMYSGLPDDQEVARVGSQRPEVESDTSGATIGRLLSYSKQDFGYLFIAFFFLILCTLALFLQGYGVVFSPSHSPD
ncbi:unnamed protein product [Staurois parvus]|uniref:Uncharacterized protein n=1 Tax=Staurois parvus TaxID=386267 RepID=A0ABN9C7S6_9NEOB|nr:unnamed protein product [Staurois parvus]